MVLDILAQTACPGKIWFSQNSGKVAKVPNLVGLLKQLYLWNGWSKSKSVWIFKKSKDSSFNNVQIVFSYFGLFTWQITFKVLPEKVVKSAIFSGFSNFTENCFTIFSGNTLE